MKLLSITIGVVLMTISSCSSEPKDVLLFRQITSDYVQIIAKKEQLFVYGTGGSFFGGPNKDLIRQFRLAFRSKRLVDLSEARAITVHCVEQLCSMVNANEEIRPFLEHYPYPPQGVDLILVFQPFNESDPYSEKVYISAAYFTEGKLSYMQYAGENKWDTLVLQETYEEALERNVQSATEI